MKKWKTIRFTEDAVKEYLQNAIENWQEEKVFWAEDDAEKLKATHYIDAFKAVRLALFGETIK